MNHLTRITSGILIGAGWAVAMWLHAEFVMAAAFFACALVCQWEFHRLAARGGYATCLPLGLALGMVWLCALLANPPGVAGGERVEAMLLTSGGALLLARLLFDPAVERPFESAAVTLLGLFYVPFMLSYYIRLTQWDASGPWTLGRGGVFLAFYVSLVVKLSDVGAYTAGRLWGRHRLFPRISPGKSWEGLAGGLLVAMATSVAVVAVARSCAGVPVTPLGRLGWGAAVLLGLLFGLLGVFGDLVESMFKRAAKAKDSSGIVPGMGGLLDVFDSLIFAPAVLYFLLPWLPA